MDSMLKEEFVKAVALKTGYTLADTLNFLNALIDVFSDSIVKGQRIDIRGFGHLDYQFVKGGKHKFSKEAEMEQSKDSVRAIFRLAMNMRELAKSNAELVEICRQERLDKESKK
jgi:nucleoid DNA-binding protein